MLIALDARTIYAPARRGTGKNLIDLYGRVAAGRPGWRFVLFHRGRGGDEPFSGQASVTSKRIEMPGDRWGLWGRVRLPLAARLAGADLLHCPANVGPRRPGVPMVLTIHDLIPLEVAGSHPDPAGWGRAVGRAARAARQVVTPSEFSKERIVKTFGLPPDKITVNHWAADSRYSRVTDAAELERVRRAYGGDGAQGYVFGFGGEDPRKNTLGILRAWSRLAGELRRDWRLVLVGIRETVMGRFAAEAERLGVAAECRLHGFAPEADIAPLLSGAAALCYPSLAEGFGLPVLDAFRCGAAVLTSSTTSLPEVAGDAAVLVDPADPEAIAAGLTRLLEDERLRADLAARGAERVKQFTWEATAGRLIEVFERVIAEGR